MSTDHARRQTALLTLIAALLVANTLALLGGALWVRSEILALSGSSKGPIQSLAENLETTRKMAQEVTQTQAALAKGLDEVARKTSIEMKALQDCRNDLGPIRLGPVDKIDQVIGLMQLLSDELMVMMKHLAATQGVLARSARPVDAQRELVTPDAPPDAPDAGMK